MGKILKWAIDTFGPIASRRDERAARLLEETLELAQAEGVTQEVAERLVARVYGRPVGDPTREFQAVAATLQAYAELVEDSISSAAEREYQRCLQRPRDEWRKRHDAKAVDGIANLSN
jgi:NTP pyrophosphatase (non-canonical NTP hydrolase)